MAVGMFLRCGVVFVLFLSVIGGFSCVSGVEDAGVVWYVGGSGLGNLSSITVALSQAQAGDTVFVFANASPYVESLLIDKSITLWGENPEDTVIDGGLDGNVITVRADNVTITGFTIQHSGMVFPNAGINVSVQYCEIYNNVLMRNFYGVTLYQALFNTVSDNVIVSNDHCGIYMSASSHNIISDNELKNHSFNGVGIYDASNNNTITHNVFMYNDYCGVNLQISENNVISQNTITYNNFGIQYPSEGFQNQIVDNVVEHNNIDLKKPGQFLSNNMLIILGGILIVVIIGVVFLYTLKKKSK